ncbi:MAG: hypothetical protein BZ135_08520 [Methanosphaera sp. rholeuAM6]|nr:MAG: hypothetical protein BZ135_08520 [Methanosphaera sp. rholeuAM6]
MKCTCNESCIKNKEDTLQEINKKYLPCSNCNTRQLKKSMPLIRQVKLSDLDKNYLRCESCGKRHIDIVMAHVLKIMIESNQISSSTSIRNVGTPLISPAISLRALPYLPEKSLVIITTTSDKQTAEKIIEEVPEIKAIIKGDTHQTVGKINETTDAIEYELLSGCDIRCDIQFTDIEPILIYKHQSKLHIEYPKEESPKIKQLDEVLDKYENPTVLDAMCGPGTLGIYAILKNAKKVLFNDIYEQSLDCLKTNLKINEIPDSYYEITNENILNLTEKLNQKYDVGIIDAFPNEDTRKYAEVLKQVCDEIVII